MVDSNSSWWRVYVHIECVKLIVSIIVFLYCFVAADPIAQLHKSLIIQLRVLSGEEIGQGS